MGAFVFGDGSLASSIVDVVELNEKYSGLSEIDGRELFTLIPLAVITLILGVYPGPFLNMIKETMSVLIDQVVLIGNFAVIP